jgi:hypothetical protein
MHIPPPNDWIRFIDPEAGMSKYSAVQEMRALAPHQLIKLVSLEIAVLANRTALELRVRLQEKFPAPSPDTSLGTEAIKDKLVNLSRAAEEIGCRNLALRAVSDFNTLESIGRRRELEMPIPKQNNVIVYSI